MVRGVVVVDSHIQRIVLPTEETTVTQQVSHRPTKYQSRSWPQRGTKVDGSHHGDILRPTEIQIATKSLPSATNREHWKQRIGVKTMFLGTNYSFYCLGWCAASIWSAASISESEPHTYMLQRRLSDVLPIQLISGGRSILIRRRIWIVFEHLRPENNRE